MLIDFTKIVGLIPDEGRLVLTFTSKAGTKENKPEGTELSIVIAQHFKGRENDNDFSPLIITGTIAELAESFDATITDIARDQTTLAALKATATTTKVAQKKKQLTEAIQKHSADQKKEPQKEERKVETREEKPKPSMTDLFSMSPASPARVDVKPAAQTEALEEEEAQEVDHG